jgi:hypothetical protein
MTKKAYPSDLIEQAQEVLTGWSQITPLPTLGTMTTATFTADIAAVTTIESQIAALEKQLTDKRTQRDSQCKSLWDKTKRAKSTVKGTYGDDSSQYKLIGGTRLSDRKTTRRKTTA